MTKFILLAARRSGTTLAIDCLNSHSQVECVKRAFGLERKIKNPTLDRHSGEFYLYRTRNLYNRIRYYAKRYDLIDSFLCDDIFSPREHIPAVGFRLIHEMSQMYPQIADWAKNNDVKVIHLVRENVLKTHLSAKTARIHKLHHPREGDGVNPIKIHINPDEIVSVLEKRLQDIGIQRNRYSGCDYLEISYESFVENRSDQSSRMLAFLGVDASKELVSNLMKINPDSIENIIENFDDVAEALKGTELERFLS